MFSGDLVVLGEVVFPNSQRPGKCVKRYQMQKTMKRASKMSPLLNDGSLTEAIMIIGISSRGLSTSFVNRSQVSTLCFASQNKATVMFLLLNSSRSFFFSAPRVPRLLVTISKRISRDDAVVGVGRVACTGSISRVQTCHGLVERINVVSRLQTLSLTNLLNPQGLTFASESPKYLCGTRYVACLIIWPVGAWPARQGKQGSLDDR